MNCSENSTPVAMQQKCTAVISADETNKHLRGPKSQQTQESIVDIHWSSTSLGFCCFFSNKDCRIWNGSEAVRDGVPLDLLLRSAVRRLAAFRHLVREMRVFLRPCGVTYGVSVLSIAALFFPT